MPSKIDALLKQIRNQLAPQDHILIDQLQHHLADLMQTELPEQTVSQSSLPTLDTKTGCYQRQGDANHYCPNCYDNHQQLHKTQRLNSKLRVCVANVVRVSNHLNSRNNMKY